MYFLGLQLVLVVLSSSFLLFRLQKVDLFLLVLELFVNFTVQRTCLKCTLNLHVIRFYHWTCHVDCLALLQTELSLLELYLTLATLSNLSQVRYLVSLLTSSFHPKSSQNLRIKLLLVCLQCWAHSNLKMDIKYLISLTEPFKMLILLIPETLILHSIPKTLIIHSILKSLILHLIWFINDQVEERYQIFQSSQAFICCHRHIWLSQNW